METARFCLTFTEGILGTAPNDEEIYRSYIASKAPDALSIEDEIDAIGPDAVAEKGMTVFSRDENGNPILWDYQIRGFFKDACGMLSRIAGKDENGKKKPCNESSRLSAYKKVIDGLIFVNPRMIPIRCAEGIRVCQRPLRAQTLQGERVALSISEEIPAGASIEIEVICLSDGHMKAVREWLDYGRLRGIGQWRNSGKGRFTFEEIN